MTPTKSDGPDLPPLIRPSADAIHRLFGAVLIQGLRDQDREWVESPDYLLVAAYAGIDLDLAELVRRKFLAGEVPADAFAGQRRDQIRSPKAAAK